MIRIIIAAAILLACTNAEARQRHRAIIAHEQCNLPGPNSMPCEGVAPSPRGERIAKQVGFGSAQKIYTPRTAEKPKAQKIRTVRRPHVTVAKPSPRMEPVIKTTSLNSQIVLHPEGCPRRLFCGCGAVDRLKKVWGIIVEKPRELWLAANWGRYPKARPAPGMIAYRRGHVFVIEADLGGGKVYAYDANAGRGRTLIHVRSLAGYTVVNPRGSA